VVDVTIADVDATWVNPAAVQYDAGELRRADAAMFLASGIVRGNNALAVSVDGSDQVSVSPGSVVIPGDAVAGTGVYRAGLSSAVTAQLQPRDATYSRLDRVIFRQLDTDVVGSHGAYTGRVEVLTGEPAAVPQAEQLPLMAVNLAVLTVPAEGGGAVTVDNSRRTYAAAAGGVIAVGAPALLTEAAFLAVPVLSRAVTLSDGAAWTFDGAAWVRDFEAARIGAAAAQTIVNATDKELTTLTTRVRSDGALHTAGQSSLRATVAGWYRLGAQVTWVANATGFRYLRIMVNQASFVAEDRKQAVSGNNTVNSVATEVYLNAGDLITANVYQNSGNPGGLDTVTGAAATHLWAARGA
jgi:hypothetical protein